jgi:hypothetical protein
VAFVAGHIEHVGAERLQTRHGGVPEVAEPVVAALADAKQVLVAA